MTLFETIKSKNIPFNNHCSDLYIPVTAETREIIAAYEFAGSVTVFQNQVEGGQWYDVPFAFPEVSQ